MSQATKRTFEANRIFVLNEPNAPRINPTLATEIGLNESLLLLQIEFYLAITPDEGHTFEGKKWFYKDTREWVEDVFPFWSKSTVDRAIRSLETGTYGDWHKTKNPINKPPLIYVSKKFNKANYDKTRWFALNYENLNKLTSISIAPHLSHEAGSIQIGTGFDSDGQVTLSHNEAGSMQDGTSETQDEAGSMHDGTTIPESTQRILTNNTAEREAVAVAPSAPTVISDSLNNRSQMGNSDQKSILGSNQESNTKSTARPMPKNYQVPDELIRWGEAKVREKGVEDEFSVDIRAERFVIWYTKGLGKDKVSADWGTRFQEWLLQDIVKEKQAIEKSKRRDKTSKGDIFAYLSRYGHDDSDRSNIPPPPGMSVVSWLYMDDDEHLDWIEEKKKEVKESQSIMGAMI